MIEFGMAGMFFLGVAAGMLLSFMEGKADDNDEEHGWCGEMPKSKSPTITYRRPKPYSAHIQEIDDAEIKGR